MNNSFLVTGGAGFIGSNFVKYILTKYPQCRVIVLDALTYAGNMENLKELEHNPRFSFYHGDIRDERITRELIKKANIVINFAAETFVDRSIENPKEFVFTDVIGTFTLLEGIRKYRVDRYIQISTDEVYGSIETGKFSEEMPIKPNNPYSASKAGADLLVLSYYSTYNLPVLITRASNNYGPFQYPEKFIPLFITNSLDNQSLPLFGDGLNVRDWIHVLDHCKGIECVLEHGKMGEVYNIGGNSERTNIEITKSILNYTGKTDVLIKMVEDRLGHDRRYALDITKISQFGWRPEHLFEEGLRNTIDWYMNNEQWWRPLKQRINRDH